MRLWSCLAAGLLAACSSTSSLPGGADAGLDDEADARPRADARPAIDAPVGGSPDAPQPSADAAPGSPDAAGAIDARPGVDAQPPLAFRPWSGSEAKLRLIDLRLFGPETGVKLCLFDADADPRPYAVLVTRGLSAAGGLTVQAIYADVPAAPGLTASVHTFFLLGGQQPDTSPAGCSRAAAKELRGSSGLAADAFYTAAYDTTDAFFAQCQVSDTPGCEFYPRYGSGPTADQCAADGLRVFRDGHLGSSGYRIINMTADASLVSHSPALGVRIDLPHVDVPFNFAEVYEDTYPGQLTFICPEYVDCMGATLAVDPFTECTSGDPAWMVGQIDDARISDDTKFTSFYLVGDVRDLASNGSGLVGPSVTVVTAYDKTN